MTAPISISPEQVMEGWREIQRQLLEVEARRKAEQQAQKPSVASNAPQSQTKSIASKAGAKTPRPGGQRSNAKGKTNQQPTTPSTPAPPPPPTTPAPTPMHIEDDDEPDRL